MNKIVLIALLIFSTTAFSEDKYATNDPEVFIKNFICSGGKTTFNVVNKSQRYVYRVNLNLFDKDGDPINKIAIAYGIDKASGREFSISLQCEKIQRIGFSVDYY